MNEAIEKIRAALEAGDRRSVVFACGDLDDKVLRVGHSSNEGFEKFSELLRAPQAASSTATWRILKCIENNFAELTAEQRRNLNFVVRHLKGELSDTMAKYMADELLVRTFEDSSE